jgi:hypothetical protein
VVRDILDVFLEIGTDLKGFSEDKWEDLLFGSSEAAHVAEARAFPAASGAGGSGFIPVFAGTIGSQLFNNAGATAQQGEPSHCGVIGGSSRWFGLQPQNGGIAGLALAGETWNVSSLVGLIGLFGIAVQNSLVLVTQTRGLCAEGHDLAWEHFVLTHRPLFDLYPQWDWATRDGAKAVDLLMPHKNVTVFYGHIHQEHHQMTGHIGHHAAMGLMFALPVAGSQPKRLPVPWDAAQPYKGLGFRDVDAEVKKAEFRLTELPVQKG